MTLLIGGIFGIAVGGVDNFVAFCVMWAIVSLPFPTHNSNHDTDFMDLTDWYRRRGQCPCRFDDFP